MTIRAGVDTGGTFTDLVILDENSGQISVAKRPSTPRNPAEAVFNVFEASGADLAAVSHMMLGTTIVTNCMLERRGAQVLYLTTDGFQDIPFIQRVDKKDPYDLQWRKPEAFVERKNCFGVRERIASDGQVLLPLTSAELERVGQFVQERLDALRSKNGDMALAINLLFSFANPTHELELKQFLQQNFPDLLISVSHQVSPIWREYERASTIIIDAFIKPALDRFVQELEGGLAARRFTGTFAIMKSNGGQMVSSVASEQPVHVMLSGLSGGIVGGKFFGERLGRHNLVTFDMGGTSTDVGMIRDGQIDYTTSYDVEFGIPVAAPLIDLVTVGAGGGSIAWVDEGGLLRVGPKSAGAVPGPVSYDLGGEEVTVTDANLVLNRLDPEYFLGGYMKLNLDKAKAKVKELGDRLGMTMEEAAEAVIEIANENMANSIRVLMAERGVDPRDFELVAFGGAGPLHASEVAAALNLAGIIVPPHPGLTSAFGTLVSDLRVDKRWTQYYRSDSVDLETVNERLNALMEEAISNLRSEGFAGTPVVLRSISMRYAGQNYERDVPIPAGELTDQSLQAVLNAFHEQHHQFYGYSFPDETIEFVHFNVTALGNVEPPLLAQLPEGTAPEPIAFRQVHFRTQGYLECPIYMRDTLPAGCRIEGPAVIEELDSTTLVLPNQILEVNPEGIFHIRWQQRRSESEIDRVDREIDSVTMSIINNHLVNIAQEMGTHMMQTAYSPIFSESKDFACALFNRDGEMIAQGAFCPAQLGAIIFVVKWVIEELGADSFEPGDVIIHNDPYRGGCHMPEHAVLKPVFYDNKLVAFVGSIGHLAEIGAMAVGSFASNATECFQEGLRLPPIKLMRQNQPVQDVWKMILANHRTPRNTWGDLHAMIGSLNVAERRLIELMDKYGSELVLKTSDELIKYSERLMRNEIKVIPDGEYTFEDSMEDDGITNRPYKMRVTVVVDGDEVLFDYTGSDKQALGPVNATFGVTASATYNAMLQITGTHIPRNSGVYRNAKIIAPVGSIVNVQYPGPSVGGNTETQPKIVGMILGAFGKALPERIMAAEGVTACNFLFGGMHPRTRQYYVHYHFEASGWGGRYFSDGNNTQNHIHGNCRNTPVEVFETLYPFLVKSYELVQDSGGPGHRRGGLASRRILEVVAPEITVSSMMDRVKEGAWGIFGGKPGRPASIMICRKNDNRFRTFVEAFGTVSPSKFANVVVRESDQIIIESAGGGGYGDPLTREIELVLRDVEEGFVSIEAARHEYGVVLHKVDGKFIVDEAETRKLRSEAKTNKG